MYIQWLIGPEAPDLAQVVVVDVTHVNGEARKLQALAYVHGVAPEVPFKTSVDRVATRKPVHKGPVAQDMTSALAKPESDCMQVKLESACGKRIHGKRSKMK